MKTQSRIRFGAAALILLFGLTACSTEAVAPAVANQPGLLSEDAVEVEPNSGPEIQQLNSEAKVLFESLPAGDWNLTFTSEGSSALLDNVEIEVIRNWVSDLEASGWLLTPYQDSQESFIGYLAKDERVINVVAGVNPSNGISTTAVLYYSESAWTGTAN